MDLVDIDKVLDDFELNENQKIESATINGGNCTPKPTGNSPLQPQGSSEPDNVEDNSKNDRAKKFVSLPVSHVFSSLDDYQRDVQSLTKEVNSKENILKEDEQYKNSQPDITPLSSGEIATDVQPAGNVRSPSEDDPTEDFQDEAECVTSASSITTSSPSSFSSGPCPGSSSESGSFISEPENKKFGDGSEKAKSKKSNENSRENTQDNNADSEYKAENGPSFVSSCQYNENISSSILGFSQDIKTDDQFTISSGVQNADKIAEQTSFSFQGELTNNENDESILKNFVPKSKVEVSVVGGRAVGFSSTMDEISDTELDSLLQDIDNDLQVFSSQSNNNEVDAVLTETLATKGSEIDSNAANGEASHAKKISKNDDFHQNADSISQASTVEFAEIRLQSDFGTDTLEDGKDTTSNSGTKNETKSIEVTIQDSGSEQMAQLDKGDEKDNQESTNLPINKTELDQPTATKQPLQRPNSLDLSNQTSEEVNINSTAGQTPPASRLDDASLLSSSSSGEIPQNLSRDGDAQDVWPPEQGNECDNIIDNSKLGKEPPFWVPDSEANACMQCKQKFSLIKRRHHCRACGQVLCSACCSQKAKLEFLADTEARVCVQCHLILSERISPGGGVALPQQSANSMQARSPNPNNPMEYCSVIPPLQQVSQGAQCPISVMVPVGVLKREGSSKSNRKDKTVIFSDGIRPGCDLTELDNNWNTDGKLLGDGGSSTGYRKSIKREQTPPGVFPSASQRANRVNRQLLLCGEVESYIPKEPNGLPPIHIASKGEFIYKSVQNDAKLIEQLQHETLKFAIHQNFYVFVKIVDLKCCINKTIINFTTLGMHHVGQDEIVILLQLDNLETIPKDVFIHLYEIYRNADKGHPVPELGYSIPKVQKFLGCKNNGGFLYIRSTFQCLQEIHLPEPPFLIGILIHQWEMPWAKIFPLRLMLRLGAEYRYYPSPHISVRDRDPVYGEISHTIINFLADFRNYSYTIPTIKGMYIHMEVRKTSISIPKNRYDQVLKAVNNSSDHILAFGGNFSKKADGHLVCIQNMQSDSPETWTYSTQAINIQGQPRKITGASFIVLNGALKTSTGLSGKCSIVEDGLMVQILPSKMVSVRAALKNMQDSEIICGPVDADENQVEIVSIKWTENDLEFNVGVKSPIDSKPMDGHPSIRVHSGLNFSNTNHTIRWTEVFIIQRWDEETARAKDSIDMSKLSEQIAKSTSKALVPFLDLLATSGYLKLGLRATLHQDNVCYEAGSQKQKLAPLYMNALDNELIPTLHKQATSLEIDSPIILELIFHILDK